MYSVKETGKLTYEVWVRREGSKCSLCLLMAEDYCGELCFKWLAPIFQSQQDEILKTLEVYIAKKLAKVLIILD